VTTAKEAPTFDLTRRIRDMILRYVMRRTEARSGVKWEDVQSRQAGDPQFERYRDAREKICGEAFLRLRACRTRDDFVSYFTGEICAEPQFLPDADYRGLAEVLLGRDDRWEDARALAMLSLSSLSEISARREDQGGTQ
jgi:CRISPR-associated protein Cmx8